MNQKLMGVFVVALAIAGGCAFLVYRIIGGHMAAAAHPVSTTTVVAAAHDIKLGVLLTAADLTTAQIVGPPPQGAVLKPADAIGRGVISELYQGEPIFKDRLAAPGSGGGLAATIPQGMRACAVKVDQVVGLAGFATPGMRVDVLASGVPPNAKPGTDGPVTKTVLQNIEVLSAGTDIQKDAEGKPHQVQVVNLLVTPEQAEALNLASNQLKIQLALRNPLDTKIAQVQSTALSSLFRDQDEPVKSKTAVFRRRRVADAHVYTVDVMNGSKHSEEKFRLPGGGQ